MSPEDELTIRLTESVDRCEKVWFHKNVYGWVEVTETTVDQHGADVFLWIKGKPFAVIVNQRRQMPKVSIFHIESALQMPTYIDKRTVEQIEKTGNPIRISKFSNTIVIEP